MKKFKYVRVSSAGQNISRQLDHNYEMYIDKCSGTVPFLSRPEANKLIEQIHFGDLLEVESIDRLGRDKVDMQSVLELLKEMGVNVRIKNLGIESILPNGKFNPVFSIVSSLLSALSEYEKSQIHERTLQGITIAKAQGKYQGRKRGSVLPRDKFIERNKKSIQIIKKHPNLSLRELAALCGVSHMKVKKIREII